MNVSSGVKQQRSMLSESVLASASPLPDPIEEPWLLGTAHRRPLKMSAGGNSRPFIAWCSFHGRTVSEVESTAAQQTAPQECPFVGWCDQ